MAPDALGDTARHAARSTLLETQPEVVSLGDWLTRTWFFFSGDAAASLQQGNSLQGLLRHLPARERGGFALTHARSRLTVDSSAAVNYQSPKVDDSGKKYSRRNRPGIVQESLGEE